VKSLWRVYCPTEPREDVRDYQITFEEANAIVQKSLSDIDGNLSIFYPEHPDEFNLDSEATMTDDTIELAVKEIAKWGPRRVLTAVDPIVATTQERAHRLNSREPDLIFIRKDGWTLGTIREWEVEAHELWESEWIAVIVRPGVRAITYREYLSLNLP